MPASIHAAMHPKIEIKLSDLLDKDSASQSPGDLDRTTEDRSKNAGCLSFVAMLAVFIAVTLTVISVSL